VEPGESALVLNTGYFGDGFADWYAYTYFLRALVLLRHHIFRNSLQTYGAQVDQLRADFGGTVGVAQVEQALQSKKFKVVTITHVDTSTGASVPSVCPTPPAPCMIPPLGVLSDPQPVAEIVQRVSPETLVVLDAVCAVASEDIKMDRWGIDVVVSASQKGLGAPPGLSVVLASQKAMKVKFVPRSAYKRSVDVFRRSSRHAQNQSPRTMPAGRGKILHVHASNSGAAELTRITDGSLS